MNKIKGGIYKCDRYPLFTYYKRASEREKVRARRREKEKEKECENYKDDNDDDQRRVPSLHGKYLYL